MAGNASEFITGLYDSCVFDQLMGDILRPGGIGLTTRLAEIAGIKQNHSILDIGCGKGMTAAFLAREYVLSALTCQIRWFLYARVRPVKRTWLKE
jgi:cyclopropane fatty-acyl-phospholipid synthase-like methyltransferase